MNRKEAVGSESPPEFAALKIENEKKETLAPPVAENSQTPANPPVQSLPAPAPVGAGPTPPWPLGAAQPLAGVASGGQIPPSMPAPPVMGTLQGATGNPGTPPYMGQPAKKLKQPYHATLVDGCLALWMLALGYLYLQWGFAGPLGLLFWLSEAQGVGVLWFTLLFAGPLLAYAKIKGFTPTKESWFWLAILLGCATSFALWPAAEGLQPWRCLLWHLAGVWWCGSLFGGLLQGKTGNWGILDGLNLLFCTPFKNFALLPRSFGTFAKKTQEGENLEKNIPVDEKNRTQAKTPEIAEAAALHTEINALKYTENGQKIKINIKTILGLLLGIGLCIPVLLMVMPLLTAADGGTFTDLTGELNRILSLAFGELFDEYSWLNILLGVPVALYLFGLVGGLSHRRYAQNFDIKKAQRRAELAHFLPNISLSLVLGMVSLLYAIFIACQVPYFFSAFAGRLPADIEIYSEYARQGFFELCRVAAFNLGLLAGAACLCRRKMAESKSLRISAFILAGLTALLVVTAFSKMLLYIEVYGLTPLRIQTSVFMIFLFLLCAAAAVLVRRRFSIVRFGLMAGSVLLCLLCLVNLDGLVMEYNTTRYLNGNLKDDNISWYYDYDDYKSIKAALHYHAYTTGYEKEEIQYYIYHNYKKALADAGTVQDTLSSALMRENREARQLYEKEVAEREYERRLAREKAEKE